MRSTMPHKTKVIILVVLLVFACLFLILRSGRERSHYRPRVVPAVSSTEMVGTAIVPTLDTPLAKSGNAIWCATFQVAWNHACDDVIGGPLSIANAQPVANRLNGSTVSEKVLPPGNYFAAAGRLEDGIVDTIREQMAKEFPGVTPPNFEEAVGFVAYGYLDTKATFTKPFVDTEQPLRFWMGQASNTP